MANISAVLNVMNKLAFDVSRCQNCRLALTRKKTVFGSGNPNARLVCIGEGPGKDEDEAGEPFVGRAGRLLRRALETIGYSTKTAYLMNVVKCRSSQIMESGWVKDVPPSEEEMKACTPWFRKQMESLPSKRLLIAFGATAAHKVLDAEPKTVAVGRSRRRFFRSSYWGGEYVVMVTYHPSYLLRPDNASQKLLVYEDLKLAKRYLEDPDFKPDIEESSAVAEHRNPYWDVQDSQEHLKWGKLKDYQKDNYTTEFEVH